MFKKATKGLIAPLIVISILLFSVIVLSYYFFKQLPYILSKLSNEHLGKPLYYKNFYFSLNGLKLHKFEVPSILKGDSLKIEFSILELIKNRSIYKIALYNFTLDIDSLKKYTKKDNTLKEKKKAFSRFRINNIQVYNAKIYVQNLNIHLNYLISSLHSNLNFIEISSKGFVISENRTIRQHLDSLDTNVKVYYDSVIISSNVYSDSLLFKKLRLRVVPMENVIFFNSKYVNFRDLKFYNLEGLVRIDSLIISSSGDSLIFSENKILNFRSEFKIKNDSIFINYARFNLMGGDVLLSGLVVDTSYNILANVKNLNTSDKTYISGNFDIKGYFSSSLNVNFNNVEVKFDTLYFRNISGFVYSKDLKNFEIKRINIADSNINGFLNGFYDAQKYSGKLNLALNYINISHFNRMIKGSASFVGKTYIYKNGIEIIGDGNFSNVSYQDYNVNSGKYELYFRDSLIDLKASLLSLKMKDSTIVDSSTILYNQNGKYALFSVIAFTNYGNLLSNGTLMLFDTLRSNFSVSFVNNDTILSFENCSFENYKKYIYVKLKNENTVFEITIDSSFIDLTAILTNYDFGKILKTFKVDSINFNGDIVMRITNRIDDPKVYLNTSLYDIQLKNISINELYSTIYYYDQKINIDNLKIVSKNGNFEAKLILSSLFKLNPFLLTLENGQIDGEVAFNGFPVDIIEPILFPNVVIDEGYIEGKAKILGSVVSPLFSGTTKIYTKGLAFTPLAIEFKNSQGNISFYKNAIRIENFVLEGLKFGSAKINGFIVFSNKFKEINVDLSLSLNKLYLSLDDYSEFFMSGSVKIFGKLPNVYIEGDLNLDEGYVSYPVGYKAKKQSEAPNPLRYYLNIKANRRIFFSNELVDAELSANLLLQKTADVGQYLEGSFKIIKGSVYLYSLNRDFRIIEGQINILRNEINLDILGEAEIYDDTITAHIMGTLENPYFELTSKKGRTQLEILNLVLSGGFSEKGINLVQQVLTRDIRRKFNINELTLGTVGNSALITLGSYISEKVYLKLSADVQNPDAYNLKVQYFINPDFSVFGERKENNYTIGIGYRIRF